MLSVTFTFCLVIHAYAAPQYSDPFARNYMFPLSAAAYSDNPQRCISHLFLNATVRRSVTVQCDGHQRDTCSGYTAVLHNENAIVLSFRGTMRFTQLIQEIKKSVFVSWSSWLFGGKISQYFHDGFQKIWQGGMNKDFTVLKTMYPGYEIWVTGHSLGGSVASLVASYLIGTNYSNANEIKLVTFGQPRIGDLQFSITHNSQLNYSFRVTHWRDIVPHIPLEQIGRYYHHNHEAFYKYNMTPDSVTVCLGSEGKRCSDSLWFAASIADHRHYFEKDVFDYGSNGCV
ncbi:unnamed protein product [Angiostrongylus costaricensis]|uniref:Lipase_3 domain-containing protein n=1 Tax=Angiostrongylus costaricensis TaxID=334426 RepID=A0A0R3PZK8_ANGCS|nr:unnamed protein product [Angiostrongylus costaricensis]